MESRFPVYISIPFKKSHANFILNFFFKFDILDNMTTDPPSFFTKIRGMDRPYIEGDCTDMI